VAIEHEALGRGFRGELIQPGDAGYDDARAVFNARVDCRPAAVVRCAGTADVIAALALARRERLAVAVRGGGRHVAGYGTIDGGLVIDLGPMNDVRVDPAAGTVRLGGGARSRDVLVEAAVHGLAPVTGVVGHVGAGGLMLGGGVGWLSPRHGFACDNIVRLEVVGADGAVLDVSADSHPELFWAMRGAGPNFGVVSSLEVKLHPVPETVLSGDLVFHADRGPAVLRKLRDLAATCSEDLYFFVMYNRVESRPGLPDHLDGLPAQLRGEICLTVTLMHLGEPAVAERDVEVLRFDPAPDADLLGRASYLDLHLDQDDVYPSVRQYWAAEHVALSDGAIAEIDAVARDIEDQSITSIYPYTHAMSRRRGSDGSFACRDSDWDVSTLAMWTDPADDAARSEWAERISGGLRERGLVATGVYPNMVSRLGDERLREYFGDDAYGRLAELKRRYDPQNVFRRNANVVPAGQA
jgi:FAD/FMN-containing dehydrogenase